MGAGGVAQRRTVPRPHAVTALLLLQLALWAGPAAAQTEFLMLKFGWAPTYCYDTQRTGPYCGAVAPPGAFRINRLFAADGNGNSRAGCSGPAFDASLISADLLPQLRCTWGSYAAVDNSEALWRSVWGEDKESGVCTGLGVGDWARLAAHLWTTYNPNKALQAAGIAAGDSTSGAAISEAFREAYGRQPRVTCRDADTLQLSSVTLCFQGSSPYSLVDCPGADGGCSGEDSVDLLDGPAPSDECAQFYGLGSSVQPSSPPPAGSPPPPLPAASPPPPAAEPSPPPSPIASPSPPPSPISAAPPPPKAAAASSGSLNQTPEQQDGPVYYIQAQEVVWDYAPSGLNLCNGKPFNVTANSGDPSVWTEQGLGRKYKKALYRRYTDSSFQTELERDARESHLGHLGPLMKAAVGQTITVYLKNALSFPVNLKVVAFQDDAAPVQPGAAQVYRFKVQASAGPGPSEPAAKLYLYRSTVDLAKHGDAGLVGPLLVSNTPPALSAARDLVTVLQIINESNSPYIDDNLAGRTPEQLGLEDQAALDEANMKHTINGYLFCNGPNLTFQQGQPARWHMASLGSETDVHNAHFHGNTALYMGHRVDQVNLLPGSTHSLDFSTENSGKWLLHCHIGDHIAAGMKGIYTVERDPSLPPHSGVKPGQTATVRNYFVAADEVDWQYVPQGKDLCGTEGPKDLPKELAYLAGETFRKALYREYTDASFTTRRMPQGDDYIMGIMGPLLRAEVGDTIRVTFKNNLKDHAVTLHPHGVAYFKNSEGSPYEDGTTSADKGDDYVQPGATYVYEWHVPETSGPGPQDPDSIIYMYHSHVDEVADVYSGLQGAIVIGRKGQLRPDTLVAKEVDREMVLFFSVINEAATLFAKQNAGNDSGYPAAVYRHVINGYSWCNMPQMVFQQGERVRLHIMALGTEIDIHAPNFMFQSLSMSGQTMASVPMFPGSMHSFDLVAANPGPALLQCRVAAHVAAGMRARLEVKEQFSIAEEGKNQAGAAAVAGPYYITAEQQQWNYAPQGIDACANTDYGDAASVFLNRSNVTVGSVYTKAVYVEYTDASFTTPKFKAGSRGLLGPTLKVEVGQILEIVFQNRLPFEVNLMLDGGLELLSAVDDKNASLAHGAPVAARPTGGMAGATVTYRYLALNTTGPGSEDLSVVPYVYTSSVDPAAHSNAGLVGVLAVGAPGAFSGPSGLPDGIKDMVPLLFTIFDENLSPFLRPQNMAGVAEPATEEEKAAFEESNLKHSINGVMYCNLPGLSYLSGSTVRFLLLGMGSQVDLHSVVFDGQLLRSGRGTGSVELIPTVARAADVTMQQAGTSGIYCAVHDHYVAGMHATLEVK